MKLSEYSQLNVSQIESGFGQPQSAAGSKHGWWPLTLWWFVCSAHVLKLQPIAGTLRAVMWEKV